MDIKSAFEYTRDHHKALRENSEHVIGVAYSPGNPDGEFQFYQLVYQETDDEDEYPFTATFEGGKLFGSSTSEDRYSGDTIEEIIGELPDIAHQLSYQCVVSDGLSAMMPEYVLHDLFPQLPDPDLASTNREQFKAKAIQLISDLGNGFVRPKTLN